MNPSRIPEYVEHSFDGMLKWFSQMSVLDLLFHPDDTPEDIIDVQTGIRAFTDKEAEKLKAIIQQMFGEYGEQVYEAAYPIFMKKVGQRLDS